MRVPKLANLGGVENAAPEHWFSENTEIGELAAICKMSVPTLRVMLRSGMKIPLDDLKNLNEAQTARNFGCITESEYREYCYRWRDSAFRYSNEGAREAARHADELGLPLPLSDKQGVTR